MVIMVQLFMFDGKVLYWYYFFCFWKVGYFIWYFDVEVDGFFEFWWDDQQKVKKIVEVGGVIGKGQDGIGSKVEKMLGDFVVEYVKFNRSICKGCMEKIEKGQVCLFKKMLDLEKLQLGMIDCWYYLYCFVKNREELGFWFEYSVSQFKGFSFFVVEDKEVLKKQFLGVKSEGKRKGDEVDGVDEVVKKKFKKEKDKDSKFEKVLKVQNDLIWNIKDELKKVCLINDLKELFIFNKQ